MTDAPMGSPIRRRQSGRMIWKLAFATVVAAGLAFTPALAQKTTPAPLYAQDSPAAIPGRYIVVFQPGAHNASAAAQERIKAFGGRVIQVYASALVGFSVEMPREDSSWFESLTSNRPHSGAHERMATQHSARTPRADLSSISWAPTLPSGSAREHGRS